MPLLSINISPGGIPKRPLERCEITASGLRGDGHNHEKHWRPEQAVCLLDLEQIEELRWEGFDIGPGSTGENLTLVGEEIRRAAIGDRLRVGESVELEITKRRQPCSVLDAIDPRLKIAARDRIGVYARVLVEGVVRPGDAVSVLRSTTEAPA